MLGAHQQVEILRRRRHLIVEFVKVGFPVAATHHLRLRHLPRQLTGSLKGPDPTAALLFIH